MALVALVALAALASLGASAGCGEEPSPTAQGLPPIPSLNADAAAGLLPARPAPQRPAPPPPPALPAPRPSASPKATSSASPLMLLPSPSAFAARLAQAPRYALDLTLEASDAAGHGPAFGFRGHERVRFTNRGPHALRALVWLLPPNDGADDRGAEGPLRVTEASVSFPRGAQPRGGSPQPAASQPARSQPAPSQPVSPQIDGALMRLPLPTPLPPGASVEVGLWFEGIIPRLPRRTGQGAEEAALSLLGLAPRGRAAPEPPGVFGHDGDLVALALAYPVLVHHGADGWDVSLGGRAASPGRQVTRLDAALYEARVVLPSGWDVAATGHEVGRASGPGDHETRRFSAPGARGFALVTSPRLQRRSRRVGPVAVSVLTLRGPRPHGRSGRSGGPRPGGRARATERLLDDAADAVTALAALVGGPERLPFSELEVVEAPLAPGLAGVSFPGVTLVSSALLAAQRPDLATDPLVRQALTSAAARDLASFLVAHEAAHQLWGGATASDRGRHPWLDEALASETALLVLERARGLQHAARARALGVLLPYHLGRLAGGRDLPLDTPRDGFASPAERALTIYGKGPLFLEALGRRERPSAWRATREAALRDLYDRFALLQAPAMTPRDVVDAYVRAARGDDLRLRGLARRWLRGRHGDEDIGPPPLATIAALVAPGLAGDPAVQAWLSGPGGRQLAALLRALTGWTAGGTPGSARVDVTLDLDPVALLRAVAHAAAGDDERAQALLSIAEAVEALGEAGADGDTARAALVGAARALSGDDPDARLWIDGADLLWRVLERPDDHRGDKARHGGKRAGPHP